MTALKIIITKNQGLNVGMFLALNGTIITKEDLRENNVQINSQK